jgi:hypothetical protein
MRDENGLRLGFTVLAVVVGLLAVISGIPLLASGRPAAGIWSIAIGALCLAFVPRTRRLLADPESFRPVTTADLEGRLIASPLVADTDRREHNAVRHSQGLAVRQCPHRAWSRLAGGRQQARLGSRRRGGRAVHALARRALLGRVSARCDVAPGPLRTLPLSSESGSLIDTGGDEGVRPLCRTSVTRGSRWTFVLNAVERMRPGCVENEWRRETPRVPRR